MELLTKENLLLAGIIATFTATIIGHYNTRRNIKTSKFIEVVTTERIKWLSTIRNEVSEIASLITNTLIFYENDIKSIELKQPTEQAKNNESYEFQKHYFDSTTQNAFKPNQLPELKDITSKLILLKLRFNPEEDLKTLELIDFFINFYQKKHKTTANLKVASEKIDSLIDNIQKMLKKEWEKVKKESKGK